MVSNPEVTDTSPLMVIPFFGYITLAPGTCWGLGSRGPNRAITDLRMGIMGVCFRNVAFPEVSFALIRVITADALRGLGG